MDRPIVYSLEEIRSFDILWGWKNAQFGICRAAQDALGTINTVVAGLLAAASSPTSLIIHLAAGTIYEQAAVDSSTYGSLPADALVIQQQGFYNGGTVTLTTAGISAGQSRWALIEATFTQADEIPASDPNNGVLPYINVANPNVPYQGPGNSGAQQNTQRQSLCTITVKYGTAATSGSEVPPAADAGYVPLYLIDLTFGQTTVTQGQILLAGPAAYGGYANAPFWPGVTGQIPFASSGSHHGGIAGQGAKIVLTAGAEVQGTAAFANLPVTNISPPGVSGIVTVAGEIPILSLGSGSPASALAGNAGDMYLDYTAKILYVCKTSGSSSTAVWVATNAAPASSYVNSSPITVAPGNITYLVDTTSGNITLNLPTAASMAGSSATFINIGSNQMIIAPQSGEKINNNSNGTSVTYYEQGQATTLWPRSAVGWYSGS